MSVAVRALADELAAAEYATTPLPDPPPLDPPMTAHGVSLPAVHTHPAGDVTATVPVPPTEGNEELGGDTELTQGMPAWVRLTVCPPSVTVVVRLWTLGLGAVERFA